jgi:hypothetical protein
MSEPAQIDIEEIAPARKPRGKQAKETQLAVVKPAEAPVVQAPASDTSSILGMIERLTFDTNIPMERVQQSYAFLREVHADQAKKAFVAAFAEAQAEMEPVAKDANNPQTKSKYASLAALDRAIRPVYTKHGFSMSFDAAESPFPDHVRVLCFLAHKSGHEKTYHVDMSCDGKGAKGGDVMTKTHAMGSAFSYGKRYLAGNIWNIASAEKDDDGNAASLKDDGPITEGQLAELIALADEVGAAKDKFCAFYKIESFADILKSQFEAAKSRLNEKRTVRK